MHKFTVLVGTDTTAPYSLSVNTSGYAAGSFNFFAKAYDAAGNIGTSSTVQLTIQSSSPADTTAPTIAITAPANNLTVQRNQIFSIQAQASDNVGVARVEFQVNGTLICTDIQSPYSCAWSVPGKPKALYRIDAFAYDAAGNKTQSNTVTVTTSR